MPARILKPGRNCWRIRRAERVAFLVDGNAYFSALHKTLPEAEQQILISAWDIYSGIRIGALRGDQSTLAESLDSILDSNKNLRARILNWDFSILFAMDREWLPAYKLGWKTHPRLAFKLDNQHPIGASHHQKFIVLDDKLAFSGGLDLTRGRWDTPDHRPYDQRRKQVDGTLGRPYHDVQAAISGDAAAALGDLFRERWRRATDQELKPAAESESTIWPEGLQADMENVDVAISRTEPEHEEYQGVREVEQLYLDAIAAARNTIYIENQYYTSPSINEALSRRLSEPDGPEIVINLPLETEGWLAQNSMDIIRVKLLDDLRRADQHDHLAVYYPYKKDLKTTPINLHAKLMFIDDHFVRVGSSNLNNRSMGLDTECDIAIEAKDDENRHKTNITHFRNRLLAEHLGLTRDKVTDKINKTSSFIEAIESLRKKNNHRNLMPLQDVLPEYEETVLTNTSLVDPEQPINPESLLYHYLPESSGASGRKRIIAWLFAIIFLAVLAGIWRFTPLGQWLEIESVISAIETLRHYPFSIPLMIAGFVIAGLLMVPVTLLVVASIIVFGSWWGTLFAITSAVLCAVVTYLIGSFVGHAALRDLAGGRINRLSQQLARQGVLTITFVRIVPVAPFTVINLVAGASHIRLRDFTVGTILGLIPGISAIALLTNRIKATLESPDFSTVLLLIAVSAAILAAGYGISQYLRHHYTNR